MGGHSFLLSLVRDRFVVVGLPRSRTSWLANLFTYGSCYCMHDGLGRLDCFSEMEAKLPSHIKHLGNSDSGYTLRNCHPGNVKVVAVFRDSMAARASFARYFSEHPYAAFGVPNAIAANQVFNHASLGFQRFVDRVPLENLFTINFADLDSVDHVEAMWNFVAPEEPFFRERYFELNALRINPASEKVRI
jgi:hypothetical protein